MRYYYILVCLFTIPVFAATYNIGPGQTYTNIGDAPWSSLAAGDTVNIYPKTAITGVTASTVAGTSITLTTLAGSIPFGSSVWWSGFTGTKTWTTCGAWGSGLYGTATGGTPCSGDVVTIHDSETIPGGTTVYFTPPYYEKIIITASGTVLNPILVQGIPDPTTGALPILDAHNATTGPNMAHHGTPAAGWDTGGFVLFMMVPNSSSWATYVTFSGFRVQQAHTGQTNYDGSNASYTTGGIGVRVFEGDHITITNDEVFGNDGGLFGATNGTTSCSYCQWVTNVTISGNHIYSNGLGSGSHQSYLEGQNLTYENNWFDAPTVGSGCSQLKDRSSGTVIRYNLFYPSARELDLVDAQNSFLVTVPQVDLTVPAGGFPSGATSLVFTSSVAGVHSGDVIGQIYKFPAWGYPGSGQLLMPTVTGVDTGPNTLTLGGAGLPDSIAAGQLAVVVSRQVSPYTQTFVYGNVFNLNQTLYGAQQGSIVHYGWDTGNASDSVGDRAGTLYSYDNTFIIQWDGATSTGHQYAFVGFQTESDADTVYEANDLIYVSSAPSSLYTPTYYIETAQGSYTGTGLVSVSLSGGNNQVASSSGIGSNTTCGIALAGWSACHSYTGNALDVGASLSLTNFSTETAAGLYPLGVVGGSPFLLQSGSSAIGAASALPAAISSNTLGLDFTPTLNYSGTARTNLNDLGATQYAAPVLTTITLSPTSASIPTGASSTQQFTATCTYSDSSQDNCTVAGGVSWSSSNTGVATVSSSGLATAGSTTASAGTTTISAANGAISGSAALTTVNIPTYSQAGQFLQGGYTIR